jgi:hypothetical protein
MGIVWTPERRAAHGAKISAARADRKRATAGRPVLTRASPLESDINRAVEAIKINIDGEMRRRIERARKKLARGTIVPSAGQIMREAMLIGLSVLDACEESEREGSRAAR